MNRNQILKHNGFDAIQLGEKHADSLLEDLLKESEEKYGHNRTKQESSTGNPLLTKYMYIKDGGVTRSVVQSDSSSWHRDSNNVADKALPASLQEPGGAALQLVAVKKENPAFAQFVELAAVTESAKTALEKIRGQAEDLSCKLKARPDQGCQLQGNVMADATTKISTTLQELREAVAKNGTIDPSYNELPSWVANLKKLKDVAIVHQDGFKGLKRKATAMLG